MADSTPKKPRVVIQYDPEHGSCSWQCEDGIPLVPLIAALELLKTMLVNTQLTDMRREQERKIVVPTIGIPPIRGN